MNKKATGKTADDNHSTEDVIGVYLYNIKEWDIPELRDLLSNDFPNDTLNS